MTPYYERNGVRLFHCDAIEGVQAFPAGHFDLVWTDPPYSSGARRDAERQVRGSMLRSMEDEDWFSHDAMTTWGFQWFARAAFTHVRPRLSQGAHVYVCIDWRQMPTLYGLLEACGYRVNNSITWDKGQLGMGTYWRNQKEEIVFASHGKASDMLDKGCGNVIRIPPVSSAARVHPTQKPIALVERIARAAPWSRALDLFSGSSPLLAVALAMGREAVGFEIDERHCETSARLLSSVMAMPASVGAARQGVIDLTGGAA